VLIEPIDAPDGTRQQIAILGTTLAEDAQLVKSIDGYIRPYNKNEMPVADQRAEVAQGFLEGSNATALDALLANIEGQRYFELNVKFIKEAKNLDEATTRIMRLPGT
jgi:flagellar basal-body rod protein FlgF